MHGQNILHLFLETTAQAVNNINKWEPWTIFENAERKNYSFMLERTSTLMRTHAHTLGLYCQEMPQSFPKPVTLPHFSVLPLSLFYSVFSQSVVFEICMRVMCAHVCAHVSTNSCNYLKQLKKIQVKNNVTFHMFRKHCECIYFFF